MTQQPHDPKTSAEAQAAPSDSTNSPPSNDVGMAPLGLCAGPGWMVVAGLLAGLVAWIVFDHAFPFFKPPTSAGPPPVPVAGPPSPAEGEQQTAEIIALDLRNSIAAGAVLGALAGLVFAVVEALRRPRRGASLALIAIGVLLAAGFGALAGFAAQEFHEAWRLDRRLEPMQRTMAMQGIFWVLVAVGVGLGLGLFAGRFRWMLGTVLQAVMSMVVFALGYVMLAGFLFPIDNADQIVPASSGNRALWCLAAMAILGLFLGLARQRRKASSVPSAPQPGVRVPILAALLTAVSFASAPVLAADGFELKDSPGQTLNVVLDGKPVARYVYAYDPDRFHDTYKPFLHVLDADGKEPITKGPGGFYTHHRGIFIGWSRLTVGGRSYNLWGMGGGVQIHQKFLDQQIGPDQASFTAQVAWNATSGEPLLEERRTFVFHRRPAPSLVMVDVASELKAVAGDTLLDGDPEHAGVHYRPANELDKTKTKYVFPQEGNNPRKDKDLSWAAETYVLGDKSYTVQQMNHPGNPKDTVWSAYRDYGRFGAFFKKELKDGQSLTLRYRFWVLGGEAPPRGEFQRQWEEYAKQP
ncbi:MAG TPA: PmoA family protein [Candidatus Anammoximicrobium sp.]|nr:PmoA family protein [Candidatus Anammoximicrobium sp.]